MGRAKQLMMEIDETSWELSYVSFECPICKGDADGAVELPVVYEQSEVSLPVSVMCCDCNKSFDGWVETNWYDCNITLDDYPELHIEAEPVQGEPYIADYEEEYYHWLEYQQTTRRPVYDAFCQNICDIRNLASDIVENEQSQMLARMLLTQSITALEVYLADILMTTVASDQSTQEKLLRSKSLELGTKNFKLADAIGIEDFAKRKLLEHLREISFHNIKKVSNLFRIGLGVEILPENESLTVINDSIKMRHDCVHRNGICKKTEKRHVITKDFLTNLTDILLKMIASVDEKVRLDYT